MPNSARVKTIPLIVKLVSLCFRNFEKIGLNVEYSPFLKKLTPETLRRAQICTHDFCCFFVFRAMHLCCLLSAKRLGNLRLQNFIMSLTNLTNLVTRRCTGIAHREGDLMTGRRLPYLYPQLHPAPLNYLEDLTKARIHAGLAVIRHAAPPRTAKASLARQSRQASPRIILR